MKTTMEPLGKSQISAPALQPHRPMKPYRALRKCRVRFQPFFLTVRILRCLGLDFGVAWFSSTTKPELIAMRPSSARQDNW